MYDRAFIVDWSQISGIVTSKLVIREYELPRPPASSILISRMTSSSDIIPYISSRDNSVKLSANHKLLSNELHVNLNNHFLFGKQ